MKPDTELLTQQGLQRRIRHHLYAQQQRFFAGCAIGFERILERELSAFEWCSDISRDIGGVHYTAPFESLYQTNSTIVCANRILLRVDEFKACSYPELYNKASQIAWERYLGFNTEIRFVVRAKKSRLHHTDRIAETVLAAIKKKMGDLKVEVKEVPEAVLCVYIRMFEDSCTLSMDSTGELLHKRGYKQKTFRAPLRESLAAGLCLLCDLSQYRIIADPLCGSGTLIIEAARHVCGIPAGTRRNFAFFSWPSFRQAHWNHVKALMEKKAENSAKTCTTTFIASDISEKALADSRANASAAGVGKLLSFSCLDCRAFDGNGYAEKPALLLANLPYGKRIGSDGKIGLLYAQFGQTLRRQCHGWNFGLIVPDSTVSKKLKLPIQSTFPFSHGGIRVLFIQGTL
ncbi:MAG: hypothetical protein JW795_15235 [Chitinivibrionales bacterium]|nr:hypothetical protein [Chitinivibrionales bacterium]